MRVLQIILITLTALSACAKKAETPYQYNYTDTTKQITAMTSDSITYLALGDSYTIGEAEPLAQSFPYQLTSTLAAASFKVHNPDIIAVTGWNYR